MSYLKLGQKVFVSKLRGDCFSTKGRIAMTVWSIGVVLPPKADENYCAHCSLSELFPTCGMQADLWDLFDGGKGKSKIKLDINDSYFG